MGDFQIVAGAGKNVEAQYVEMMVPLYSHGCQNKIKKALANIKGIYSINADFHRQKVTVWGICDKHDVLRIVKSKRKGARFWNLEDDNANIQLQESRSAPPSPPPPSLLKNTTSYFDMIRRQSLKLNLSVKKLDLSAIKRTPSVDWKSLKKAFLRSNSF